MSFIRCTKCKEFHWSDKPCAKKWKVRDLDEDDLWTYIYANSADEAAEKYCEQQDARGDYTIIKSGGADKIEVSDPETQISVLYSVEARTTANYYAREKK